MFNDIDALIFDLDGTLVDSMGIWHDIDVEYLARFGLSVPDDLQKEIEGMCFLDTAKYFKKRFNISDDLDDIMKAWNDMTEYKYSHSVPLKDGVLKLLEFGRSKGYKLGIATSNSRKLTELLLEAKGLTNTFDYVLTGCDSLKSKPDPEIYLTAASKLNVRPERCLVFEDIVPGILAGKNAGMKVCAIDDEYSSYARADKMKLSDYYLYSYNDIDYSNT